MTLAETRRSQTRFLPVQMDVIGASSVSEAAAEVEKTFGKLRSVFDNADLVGHYGLIGWMQVIDVTLQGSYLVTRAFLPLLLGSSGA